MERREALIRLHLAVPVLHDAENLRPAALHRGGITAAGPRFWRLIHFRG